MVVRLPLGGFVAVTVLEFVHALLKSSKIWNRYLLVTSILRKHRITVSKIAESIKVAVSAKCDSIAPSQPTFLPTFSTRHLFLTRTHRWTERHPFFLQSIALHPPNPPSYLC